MASSDVQTVPLASKMSHNVFEAFIVSACSAVKLFCPIICIDAPESTITLSSLVDHKSASVVIFFWVEERIHHFLVRPFDFVLFHVLRVQSLAFRSTAGAFGLR